jgi:hypothetical protein
LPQVPQHVGQAADRTDPTHARRPLREAEFGADLGERTILPFALHQDPAILGGQHFEAEPHPVALLARSDLPARRLAALECRIEGEHAVARQRVVPRHVAALGAEPLVAIEQGVLDHPHQQAAELVLVTHHEARRVAQEVEHGVLQVVLRLGVSGEELAEATTHVLLQPGQVEFDQ